MFRITVLTFFVSFFCFSVLAQKDTSKNTVIINNEVQDTSNNELKITAPALVPSPAGKLRTLRENQEVQTEDSLLKELEKQRLLDEQKRLDSLMGQGPSLLESSSVQPASVPITPAGLSLPYSYMSFGIGAFFYYNVENVNTLSHPAGFLSFGTYQKPFIIDFSGFYSTAILTPQNTDTQNNRQRIYEPGVSATVKYSLFNKSATKPYAGVSGALVGRRFQWIQKDGTVPESSAEAEEVNKDVGEKRWDLSAYIGGSVGLDIALAKKLGINIDLKYYVNLTTENRLGGADTQDSVLLDKRDLMTLSANFKYLF